MTRPPPGWSAQAARAFASAPSRQSAEALRQQLRSLPAESDLQSEIDGVITELGGSQGNVDAGWEAILDVVSEQGSEPQAQRRLSPDGQTALAVRCAVAMQARSVRTEPLWGKLIDIARGAAGKAGLDALATVTCALVKLNIDAPVLLDPIAARFNELCSSDPPPASERTYEMCLQRRNTWGSPEPATANHAKVLCAAARSATSVAARSRDDTVKLVEAFEGHGTPNAAATAAMAFFTLHHGDVAAIKTVAANIGTSNVWLAVLPALSRMDPGPRSGVWFAIREYIKRTAVYDSFSPEGLQLETDRASLDRQITQQTLANAGELSPKQAIAVLALFSGADAVLLAENVLPRLGTDFVLMSEAVDAMQRAGIAGSSPLWRQLLNLPGDPVLLAGLLQHMVNHIAVQPAARSGLLAPLLQRALAAPVDFALAALCVRIRQCVSRFPQGSAPSAEDLRLIEQLTMRFVQNVAELTLERSMALLEVLSDGHAAEQVATHVLSNLTAASDASLISNAADAMLQAGIAGNSPLWQRLLRLPSDPAQSLPLIRKLVDFIVVQPATRSGLWAPLLKQALAMPVDDALAVLCVHIRQCVGRFPLGSAPSADDQGLIDELTERVVKNVDALSLQVAIALLEVAPRGDAGNRVAEHVLSKLSSSDIDTMRKTAEAMLRGGISLRSPLWRRLLCLPVDPAQTATLIGQVLGSAAGEKPEIIRLCFERARELPATHRADVLTVLRTYFLLPSTETNFTGQDALTSLGDLLAITLGKTEAVPLHTAYKQIGPFHGAVVCLNATQFKTPWPDTFKPVWKQVIFNAASSGRLRLNEIAEIAAVRAGLRRDTAPHINWNHVFDAKQYPIAERRFLGGSVRIREALSTLLAGLRQLAPALESYGHDLHKAGVARTDTTRVDLMTLSGNVVKLIHALFNCPTKTLKQAIDGLPGANDPLTRAMVSNLVGKSGVRAEVLALAKAIGQALKGLPPNLGAAAKAWLDAWNAIEALVKQQDFGAELDRCDDYLVQMLDLDNVDNLVLGHTVSCCISPDGAHSDALLDRLSGGWFLWAVRNTAGSVTTVAWATLNQNQHLVIDFIDQRVNFRTPESRSNDMVEQLLAYATNVAAATHVAQVWLAEPAWGRLNNLPAFTSRTFAVHDFVPLTPTFLGTKTYVDRLNGRNTFSRLV